MSEILNREALIELIDRIRAAPGRGVPEEEIDQWILLLKRSVPHPRVTDLIFWPDLCGFDQRLRSDEIADIALKYDPSMEEQ